jgi:hypothetical protein
VTRALTLALSALLAASPAFAQADAGPKAPAAETAAPAADAAREETPEEAKARRARKKRYANCGCARPRLLRVGKEVILDEQRGVGAWVRDGKVELGAFERIKEGTKFRTQSVPVPLGIERFDLSKYGEPVASKHHLVRAFASGEYDGGFLLGLLRTKNQLPADVVRARVEGTFAHTPSEAPEVERLWLSPFTHRVHPSCGPSDTHRLFFEVPEEGADLAGFVVASEGRAALVDERHARGFGIGRVEPCDQGLELKAGVARVIEVYPIGWDLAVGEPFRFRVTADPGMHPVLASAPDGADDDVELNPFLNPPPDPMEDILSDDKDTVALGAMLFVMFGAIAIAGVIWRGWRRRRLEEVVECPVCEAEITLNLMDPSADGMFCPNCKKSSVFVTFEPDGTPRARVYKLD